MAHLQNYEIRLNIGYVRNVSLMTTSTSIELLTESSGCGEIKSDGFLKAYQVVGFELKNFQLTSLITKMKPAMGHRYPGTGKHIIILGKTIGL